MKHTIALAGNPNAGKTSLFNILTGTRQYVGNWPGVTVEKKEGWIKGLSNTMVVDLPGIYSLSAQSIEEKVAVTYLLEEKPDAILNIVDASNLERNLYFSVQLLEMGLPTVLVLNMVDVASQRGMEVDTRALEQKLGVPVLPMVARKGTGHQSLLDRLGKQAAVPSMLNIAYPAQIEEAIGKLAILMNEWADGVESKARWLAMMWLERNETVERLIRSQASSSLVTELEEIRKQQGKHADYELRNARYNWIEQLIKEVVTQKKTVSYTWSDRIDNLVMHRIWGIPVFLLFMFLVFQVTYSWIGTALSDRLDEFFSGPAKDGLDYLLALMNSPDWFSRLMTDGILAGVGSVLVFVPQIAILFFCLSFLEDSGYMARAAIVMDRFMRSIGLNGKAFIPLILGFGCNVPAIMATRTLEDEKGRLVTAFISPFMSCSARLSVYSLFVSAFFDKWQGTIVFLLYVTGIVMAILTAFLLRRFISYEEGMFIMELPPYRSPMMKSLLLHTWDKARGFVRKAGTIIFGMSVLLWFLGSFSMQGLSDMNHSFLAAAGGMIAPFFAPLGFGTWQAGVSLVTGFLAKEVVVSTMGIIYGAGENADTLGNLLHGTFTPAAAMSFLFFVLLYTPCVSTVMTLKKETGSWKWTILSVVYSLVVAWVVSYLVYYATLLVV